VEDRAHELQSVFSASCIASPRPRPIPDCFPLLVCHLAILSGPAVTFMLKHLELSGCPVPADNIICTPCSPVRTGGFHPIGAVVLCQSHFMNKKHMEDTLTHELVHMYDHCRFKVDWNNLRHHACSEVSTIDDFA
jgi:Peptidase M76 family